MPNFSVRRLKNPTASQVDEAVSLCLRAYEGDNSVDCLVNGDKSLVDPLFRAMIRATAVGGEFYVAVNDSDKIVGLGLWFGPGPGLVSREGRRILDTSPGAPGLDSFFLSNLATDPAFQRMGVATKIVDTVFQQAIAEDNRLVLMAGNALNVLIYERMGFRNEGYFDLEAPAGSMTCTLFTKDARDK